MSGDKKVIDSIGHGRMLEKERRIGMTGRESERENRVRVSDVLCHQLFVVQYHHHALLVN